ncbi:hypothetical protein [Paracoccus sp. AS002]|uniref:hypothetical protein n=1 Tax=Paracoccus sp. AS002 TaxID=3019545 RepID=UPI0023E76E89|nr:hypothetical protein [Paracoccus sp. AS002]MDF3907542.1 hypothetical protein [Paracoccus sp. AS002]
MNRPRGGGCGVFSCAGDGNPKLGSLIVIAIAASAMIGAFDFAYAGFTALFGGADAISILGMLLIVGGGTLSLRR